MSDLGDDDSALRNSGDASDADSDLEELEGDIAKFNESVQIFLASRGDEGAASRVVRGGPHRRGGARGPRKAAKPRGDITARLSKVNQAFMGGDYDRALDLAFEVIRINAETHQAWITVASIFQEQGDSSKALSAMIYAAHLRPKDVSGWLQCATFALDTIVDDEAENLYKARVCYSAALRADHSNVDARLGKATVCHRQGHLSAAISEYKQVLKRRPFDLEIVRRLAEACVDNKHSEAVVPAAIEAYERYFEHEKLHVSHIMSHAPWQDIGIYVDLFASTGRYFDAIRELKALSRWFLGRGGEQYWDLWQEDDREWDADHDRRVVVSNFLADSSDLTLYGQGLPHDLRARLAIYRLRQRNEAEATRHLLWLDPTSEHTKEFAADFPDLVFDLAEALACCSQTALAIKYYEILRDIPGETDATVFLQLGRCYSVSGEHAAAEEYFLAAIDADEDNIEARIELANMYEKAREEEEALILAAEAIALREARERGDEYALGVTTLLTNQSSVPLEKRTPRRREATYRRENRKPRTGAVAARSVIPRRYRPKRLAGPDKRRQDEQAHALKLTEQYEIVRHLRQQIRAGRDDLLPTWMTSSKELIDDFRSLKKFYTWEKYLHFLGRRSTLEPAESDQPKTELSQMYERLARTLAPHIGQEGQEERPSDFESHQGISFEKWLDLFLEYAIGLAIAHRREEAYQVCEAARDSTAFQAPEHCFTIYVAWSVCAIYTSDEEKCVATARQLMRDGAMSDSYRMFALLSSLCQSPVSWYTSGPAQKYILRQIKAMDEKLDPTRIQDKEHDQAPPIDATLDSCLLMLYGHILFTSTSYTYALGYFLRARALDPDNAMVNLSLGLAYVHYGLKRQSTNRQYLLLQGQSFMSRYTELSCSRLNETHSNSLAEAFYNIGRLYQLLGINYLAYEYYSKARGATKAKGRGNEINAITLNNELMSLLNIKNNQMALKLVRDRVKI
ncbi:Fc.00g075680.m01.CDS01 [Cosmosporella sp. VM-42]